MDRGSILAWRLIRQGLDQKETDPGAYLALFARLQPVAPVYFSMPGSPPGLVHRTAYDDGPVADQYRGQRRVVKGRFAGGSIAYVLAEELALYAVAYCKPIRRFTPVQEQVLDILRSTGPLSSRQLRQESGLRHKQLMPALHRLQQAFLLYEDQEDGDWSRPWCLFGSEWPDIDLEAMAWEDAAAEVCRRQVQTLVFADFEALRHGLGFAVRDLRRLLADMEEKGVLAATTVEGLGPGWMLPADRGLPAKEPAAGVFMLHKADPLARPYSGQLKARFAGREVLQYLLIDGEWAGAVCGHWRIGPHDVEDVIVEAAAADKLKRRDAVLAAVAWGYRPPRSHIRRYDGQVL